MGCTGYHVKESYLWRTTKTLVLEPEGIAPDAAPAVADAPIDAPDAAPAVADTLIDASSDEEFCADTVLEVDSSDSNV
jgi:hypothetical protein